jgi:hypothetical protein
MKKLVALSIVASLAASICALAAPAVAGETVSPPVRVHGEKLDSGLGDLPHYSTWADPSGRNPLQARASAGAPSSKKQPATAAQVDAKRLERLTVQAAQIE